MPRRHRLDRLLVLAFAALVVAISWDAFDRRANRPAAVPLLEAAPVPELVRLVPSSTSFLTRCPAGDLHLSVGPGRTLTLRFAGSRCHVPPLHLLAVVTDGGRVVYRGPALAHEDLSGNYAVSGLARARLLAPCGAVAISGSGLRVRGRVRCS